MTNRTVQAGPLTSERLNVLDPFAFHAQTPCWKVRVSICIPPVPLAVEAEQRLNQVATDAENEAAFDRLLSMLDNPSPKLLCQMRQMRGEHVAHDVPDYSKLFAEALEHHANI